MRILHCKGLTIAQSGIFLFPFETENESKLNYYGRWFCASLITPNADQYNLSPDCVYCILLSISYFTYCLLSYFKDINSERQASLEKIQRGGQIIEGIDAQGNIR